MSVFSSSVPLLYGYKKTWLWYFIASALGHSIFSADRHVLWKWHINFLWNVAQINLERTQTHSRKNTRRHAHTLSRPHTHPVTHGETRIYILIYWRYSDFMSTVTPNIVSHTIPAHLYITYCVIPVSWSQVISLSSGHLRTQTSITRHDVIC